MLKTGGCRAIKDGKFHIYAVKTIDEGIELLTGLPAGERGLRMGPSPKAPSTSSWTSG